MLKAILEKETMEENYVEVVIVGDCNDADYNTTIERYGEKVLKDEEFLKAVYYLDYIGNPREDHLGEKCEKLGLSYDEAVEINDLIYEILDIPSDDYDRCHTILSVDITLYKTDGSRHKVTVDKDDE